MALLQLLPCHLVSSHVVEEALGRDEVQGSPVLVLQLRHNQSCALKGFLALLAVDQVDENKEVHVEVNLENALKPCKEQTWGVLVNLWV